MSTRNQIKNPDSGRPQGLGKKIFKAIVNGYHTITAVFVKPDLQKQLEALNKVLFEKRHAAGFMGGGR